jgi:molybdopterin synthase catalytic subunit
MAAAHIAVTDRPIDAATLLSEAASASDGAVLLFLGVVRNHSEGREVGHLEYEAYAPMAERVMGEIALEAAARWETGTISVVHRVGRLGVGEVSVAIAVAAPHRGDAYAASRYVIDEVKHRVPVWKREGYTEGESEWLPGTVPRIGAEGGGT